MSGAWRDGSALRVLAAPLEDPGSFSNTHDGRLAILAASIWYPLLASMDTHTYTCTHTNNIIKLFKEKMSVFTIPINSMSFNGFIILCLFNQLMEFWNLCLVNLTSVLNKLKYHGRGWLQFWVFSPRLFSPCLNFWLLFPSAGTFMPWYEQ